MNFKIIAVTCLTVFSSLIYASSVQAKTPNEVLEPYKSYRTALKEGEKSEATKFAYEAWQKAEELMGDTKTTGDLASNFADLAPRVMKERSASKQVSKAFERSIELSSFYDVDAPSIELQRRIDYINWGAREWDWSAKNYRLDDLDNRIAALGFNGKTFHAESQALRAQLSYKKEDWKDVTTYGERALEIFNSSDDGVVSYLRYLTPIYVAKAYEERKDPIKAAITYQTLITDLDAHNAHDNEISGKAYAEWLRLRDEVLKDSPNDPRADAIRSYSVPEGRTAELQPLLRMPPRFPSSFIQGSKSGRVVVLFDLNSEGRIENPTVFASTDRRLHKASLKSLEGWRYTPNIEESRRKGIKATIRFELSGLSGRRYPEDDLVER